MKIGSFDEARAVLMEYVPATDDNRPYTLQRMRRLMAFLGNPQDGLKVIHVAGTSGKTSTAYYVSSLLKAAGQKVGLTVSPHIDEINERVQINMVPLPETKFCSELQNFLARLQKFTEKPTYFELLVAFAYWEFAKQKVDYAVVEVGLGGLLDGTNVVTRADKVCVITDIGLDHTDRLGHSYAEIAAQKAGIIAQHNHVFTFHQFPDVMTAIQNKSEDQHATLQVVPPLPHENAGRLADLPLFQLHNFELAQVVFDFMTARDNLPVLSEDLLVSAAHTVVPARMEIIQLGEKTIVLDGAHNAQKMRALANSMRAKFSGQSVTTLLAVVQSSDFVLRTDLKPILDISKHLIITSYASQQDYPKVSVDPEEVAAHCRKLGFMSVEVMPDPATAFRSLLKTPQPVLLVTGSFYLMNHIRPLIKSLTKKEIA